MTSLPHPTLRTIARDLDTMSTADLYALQAIVTGLIEAREDNSPAIDEPAPTSTTTTTAGKHGGRGHIELKTINGCGPYKYLRYWQGGKLKSEYIGKAARV